MADENRSVCSFCDNELDVAATTCSRCGIPVPPPPPAPEPEPEPESEPAPEASSPGSADPSCSTNDDLIDAAALASKTAPSHPKSKTKAVWLVVLFGIFGWLYTYKKDAVKFWVSLPICIVLLCLVVGLVLNLGFTIWAIVSVSRRDRSFYENYPN